MRAAVSEPMARPLEVEANLEDEIEKIELMVGRVLQVGVITSAVLIILGTLLMIRQHDLSLRSSVATFSTVGHALRAFRGWAVVDIGLLVLILTPVLRVAISILGFARARDWTYVTVTAYVLAMLITGFLIGKA